MGARALHICTIAILLLTLPATAVGQTPDPRPAAQEPVVESPLAAIAAPEKPAKPNPYAGDLFRRLRLTGDWGGARTALADRGLTFDLFATQFYQGVASGGQAREWEYGGKVDYLFNLDGQKLGLWQGFFLNLHAETRYGTTVNDIDGLIAPSNIAMNFPDPERSITSITGVKFVQALSENFALFAGKINTLDEYGFKYSPGLGTNKPRLEGFMNTSLVFNPIVGRTVPYSAAGAGGVVMKSGEPLLSLSVFDPQERATEGLEDLFARGAVVIPDLFLNTKFLGRPGKYNFGGTYSSAKYRSVDPAAYLNIINQVVLGNPTVILASPVEAGSSSVYANFYQSLWVDESDEKRNWGVFGQFGISDGNPNPVQFVANGGIGGRSMIPGRKIDTFGVGYFYLRLSNNFKDLTRPFQPQRDEDGVEMFYNYAITPWSRLTGDLQIARPTTIGINTAIIPGLRLQILF